MLSNRIVVQIAFISHEMKVNLAPPFSLFVYVSTFYDDDIAGNRLRFDHKHNIKDLKARAYKHKQLIKP